MSEIRENYFYTKEHEWIKIDGEFAYLGITDYAQNELGEIVYVDYEKDVEDNIDLNEEFATLESTKSASPVYAPIVGEIVEINEKIEDDSEVINQSPYDDGWLVKVKINSSDELNNLMNAKEYEAFLKTL